MFLANLQISFYLGDMDTFPTTDALAESMGARLRRLRIAAGLSLAEVAARTDVSEATMSRIENGRSDVSAPHLFRLAALLGADVASFFDAAPQEKFAGIRSIQRAGQGQMFETQRLRSAVLCSDLQGKAMHPFMNSVNATDLKAVGGLSSHQGEEYLLVQRGRLVLHSAAYAPALLETGDSVYFDATMPHAYVAADAGGADFLVVCTSADHMSQKDNQDE